MDRVLMALAVAAVCVESTLAQATFRAGVELVTVPVTVTARDHSPIGNLGPADFRVYEDGVLQDVAIVSREPQPLSLCILLDSSPSMAGREDLATGAIDTLLKELGADDEVALLTFSYTVKVTVPWTRAADIRSYSWYGWRLSLGTALIDALKEALVQVEHARNPFPVVLIVSDGGEMSSATSLAKLVSTRRQSETPIYGLETERLPSKTATRLTNAFAVDYLPDLVGDSGGTVFRANTVEAAQSAAHAFLDELRSQYTVGYAPKTRLDGRYRKLEIQSTNPAFAVRHREGYVAQPRR